MGVAVVQAPAQSRERKGSMMASSGEKPARTGTDRQKARIGWMAIGLLFAFLGGRAGAYADVGPGNPASPHSCIEPTFVFKRLSPRSFLLTAKADSVIRFQARINELNTAPRGESGRRFFLLDSAVASPEGKRYDVFLDSLDYVVRRGGYVKIFYEYLDSSCLPREGFQLVKAFDVHVLQFDAGLAYNLEHDGGWKSSSEYGIRAASLWPALNLSKWWMVFPPLIPFYFPTEGTVDLRYVSLGRLDTAGSGQSDPVVSKPKSFDNPFNSRDGVFRSNFSLMIHPSENARAFSFIIGGGATSVPASVSVDLRPRYFIGLGLAVDDYNIGEGDGNSTTTGEIHFLIARDNLWRWKEPDPDDSAKIVSQHEYGRLVLEGILEIPGLGGPNIKPALQGYIDLPLASANFFWNFWKQDDDTKRLSVVHISALLHFDLTALRSMVGKD